MKYVSHTRTNALKLREWHGIMLFKEIQTHTYSWGKIKLFMHIVNNGYVALPETIYNKKELHDL